MKRGRFEIRADRYDENWKEETVTLFDGAIKEQMLNLMRGLRSRQGPKVLRIYLFDVETGEESNEYVF